MWELLKLELRKVLPLYVMLLAAVTGTALLRNGVLAPGDPWLAGAGALLGAVVGLRLFTDGAGTRPFLFSRPFGRKRLFLARWVVGIGLIALVVLVATACVAAGLRQWLQLGFHRSPWYPMARWYDLNGIWPIALSALLAYGVTLLLVTRNDLETVECSRSARWGAATIAGSVLGLFGLAIAALAADAIAGPAPLPSVANLPVAVGYTFIVIVATSLSALYGYRRLPVES